MYRQSPFEVPDRNVDGLIKFLVTEKNTSIGFFPEETHFLISGMTGFGKTTLLIMIFSQILLLALKGLPYLCWLFVKATDTRALLKIQKSIVVVNFSNIKINLLEPPIGISVKQWTSIFSDFFCQTYYLFGGSKSLLIECLSRLYDRFKKLGFYPSLFDLQDYLKRLKFPGFSRLARYQESILNRLSGLLNGPLSEVLNCSKGHTNILLKSHTIFEIQYLTSDQQTLIVNYFLLYLYHFKLKLNTLVRHFVGIDDSNQIFDASLEKRPEVGLPIIHEISSTVRKTLINLFAITQVPSKIGSSILSNAFAMIMFALSNGRDTRFMLESMGIKNFEQQQFCYQLPKRTAVVKFASRYPKPFMATVPEFNIGETRIPDDFVELNNQRLFQNFKIQGRYRPVLEVKKPENQPEEPQKISNCQVTAKKIDTNIYDFLSAVNLNEFQKSSTEIYEVANLSAGTGSRTAKDCEKKGYIKIIRVSWGRGRPRYPILTKKGCEYLGIKEKVSPFGKGAGEEHKIAQIQIQNHFSVFNPKIELNRNDKFMDIGFEVQKKLIATEVAMTAVNEKINIEKDIQIANASFVIVACKDKKVLSAVKKIISELPEDLRCKCQAYLIGDVLKSDPEKMVSELLKRNEIGM